VLVVILKASKGEWRSGSPISAFKVRDWLLESAMRASFTHILQVNSSPVRSDGEPSAGKLRKTWSASSGDFTLPIL